MSFFRAGHVRHNFVDLGRRIRDEHPELEGEHIFKQLDALGLRVEFDRGSTPHMLPYSFTDPLRYAEMSERENAAHFTYECAVLEHTMGILHQQSNLFTDPKVESIGVCDLHIKVVNPGRSGNRNGHPDTWEPGEGPEWVIQAATLWTDDNSPVGLTDEKLTELRERINRAKPSSLWWEHVRSINEKAEAFVNDHGHDYFDNFDEPDRDSYGDGAGQPRRTT